MPPGQEIGDARAQQPGPVDGVLDADGGDRAQVRQEVGAMVAREARRIAAAEAQRAGGKILAGQRHQGRAFQIDCPGNSR